jgi:hypothetical protein
MAVGSVTREQKRDALGSPAGEHKVYHLYLFVLWSALLCGLAGFLADGWHGLRNPFQLEYGEGVVLWQAQHVTDLKQAFGDVRQLPHMVFHYTPLFHLTSRLAAAVTGDLLIAGRLVSLLSLLGISGSIALLVWGALPARMPVKIRAAGAASGAMLCYSVPPMFWARFMRVDVLAVFLEFAGIYLYVRGRRRPALEYAAFFCFFLAIYAKQIAVAGALACAGAGFLVAPKRTIKQVGLLVVCCAITLLALAAATDGRVLLHLFAYNRNPLSLTALYGILKPNISSMAALVSLALGLPVAFAAGVLAQPSGRLAKVRAALRRSPFHRALIVCGLFLLFTVLVSLSAAKKGAAINYMLEWNLACCPLAAMLIAAVLHWSQRRRRIQPAHLAILIMPILTSLSTATPGSFFHEEPHIAEMTKHAAAVLARIRQVSGPVYSTDMVLLYHANKAVLAEPAIITVMAEGGQWDETGFVSRIDSEYFDLIVTESSLSDRLMFSPAVASAINRAYQPGEEIGNYKLYWPRRRTKRG